MIRHIVAVDIDNGIARDGKIPWHLKGDSEFFVTQIKKYGSRVVVAAKTYEEIGKPIAEYSYIWSHRDFTIEKGEVVHDLMQFLKTNEHDLWVIGGATLYEATIGMADELYITRINASYNCDRFYPINLSDFALKSRSRTVIKNGVSYHYEVYARVPTV